MLRYFRILRKPHYFIYFAGQSVSMSGSWMQSVIQSWIVYRLSHSGTWLGIITLFNQLPAFLFSPIAGVVADHGDRRKVLLCVQVIAMLQALLLGFLVATNHLTLLIIASLAAVLGIINAFEITTRHAFTVDMVGKAELPSAIALNSFLINTTRMVGPAIAGILLSPLGEAGCFYFNAISYIGVIYSLIAMKTGNSFDSALTRPPTHPIREIREGVKYVLQTPQIHSLLVLATLIAFIGFPFTVLLPILAHDALHGDAKTLSWLSTASGLGSIIGGLSGGLTVPNHRFVKNVLLKVALLGVSLAALGVSSNFWASLVSLFFIGYFLFGIFPGINSQIQIIVEDSMRGRVLSLYSMTFLGALPVSHFLAGWFADRVGVSAVLLASGLICLLFCGIHSLLFPYKKREAL